MADGLQVWATNDVLTATKLNKVAKHAVIDCTAATHPASPVAGTTIFETDTELLRTYDGSAYHSYAKGILDHDSIIAQGVSTSLGVLGGSGVTWNAVTGEMYVYEIDICVQSASNDETVNVLLQMNTGAGYADTDVQRGVPLPFSGVPYSVSIRSQWMSTVTGSVSMRTKLASLVGLVATSVGTDCCLSHLGSWA